MWRITTCTHHQILISDQIKVDNIDEKSSMHQKYEMI
jgi:hypothetical protein